MVGTLDLAARDGPAARCQAWHHTSSAPMRCETPIRMDGPPPHAADCVPSPLLCSTYDAPPTKPWFITAFECGDIDKWGRLSDI